MGAASLAAGTVYFGRFGRDVPLVPATAVQLGAAAILTVALTIVFEHPHAVWTFPAVASVAWNVLAVSVGAMALYYYMLSHGTAGRVAANFYLIPGTVALLGWTLLGESLTLLAALGGRDVVVAVVVRGGPGRVRPVVFSLSGPPSRWPGSCAADHFPSSRSRN